MIPKYGYVAAAYTTLASYLISFVLHSRYARKLEPNLYPLGQFMKPIIQLLTVTVIFYAFKNQLVIRWLLMAVYIASRFYKERKRLKAYFPNGFLVLSDEAEFCYKVNDFWHPNDEGGMAWNDPEIGIEWPELKGEYKGSASAEGYTLKDGTALNLSDKDQKWLGLKDTFKF